MHGKYELVASTLTNKIKKGIEPCRYCSNPKLKQKKDEKTLIKKKTSKKFNEAHPVKKKTSKMFNEAHPELIKEWSKKNKKQPNEISEFSKAEIIWKCERCGHEWTAKVAARSRGYKKCPFCYPFGKKR